MSATIRRIPAPPAADARGSLPPTCSDKSHIACDSVQPIYVPPLPLAATTAALVFIWRVMILGVVLLAPLALLWLEQCIYAARCLP
jgi:hypothetical protein